MLETLAVLLIPPGIHPFAAAFLVALAFCTAALTGAMGLGGGVLMLAAMTQLLPPTVLLPVHGLVQVGSNFGRAFLMREHVVRRLLIPFVLGSALGVSVAAPIVDAVPRGVLLFVLGLFILWSAWAPKLRPSRLPPPLFFIVGAASSFCTMFVGATGPFVAAFLVPDPLTRHQTVATLGAFMMLQHALKVAAFTVLGFALLPWLPMIAVMIGVGFLGTMFGRRFLDRIADRRFALGFKLMLSVLALKIVWDGIAATLR
jgi:uncharacterized membrane protein YfcA